MYYKESFEEAQNSPRKIWSLINSFIKKERKSKFPEFISLKDESTTNKLEKVADILNAYIAKIGEKIVSSLMNYIQEFGPQPTENLPKSSVICIL